MNVSERYHRGPDPNEIVLLYGNSLSSIEDADPDNQMNYTNDEEYGHEEDEHQL